MYEDLKRINFEDYIWLLFATLSFLNIFENYNQKEYIITNYIDFSKYPNTPLYKNSCKGQDITI